jgi:PAS domain S-box-containing protein
MEAQSEETWQILLVDDDEDDYCLARTMLRQARGRRIELEWASTFTAGEQKLRSNHYHAVLVDYDLGGRSGIELIRETVARGYPAPLILYTGRGSSEVDVEAMQAGATLYVTKSEATPLLLERSLRYAIERKRLEAERLSLALFPGENPNPVMRISAGGELLYTNDPGRALLKFWDCEAGQSLPDGLLKASAAALKTGASQDLDIDCGDRTFSFVIAPIMGQGYVNLYGRDATERKRVEEVLRQANDTLQEQAEQLETQAEELQAQTEELVKTNERLYQSGQIAQHSLAELRSIYAAAPVGLCFLDTDLRYRAINERLAKVNQLPAAMHIGRKLKDVLFQEFADKVEPVIRQVLATGEPVQELEISGAMPDSPGQARDWLVSCHPVRGEDGGLLGVSCMMQEITARKQGEEALRRFELLAAHARDKVLLMRRDDGRILEANAAAIQGYGYSYKELLSMTILDLRASGTQGLTAEQMARADVEGILFETIHRRKDGSEFPVEVSSRGATIGGVRTLISVIRDITERKKAGEELRGTQADLARAQAVALTGSWRLDVRRNELVWSDETYRMFGIPIGVPLTYEVFLACVHPDDREYVDRSWSAAIQDRQPYDFVHRIQVGEELKWVRERAELEFDVQGNLLGGFGIVHDITRRKGAEEALRQANTSLQVQAEELEVQAVELQAQADELAAANEQLHGVNLRLSVLSDAAAELLAGVDPIARLDAFFQRISESLGLEVYVQYNVSNDGTHLELGSLSGFPLRYHKVLARLEFGQAVCGTVAQTRKPMYVNDVQRSKDRKTRLIRSLGIGTYACHPLMVEGRLLGTLSFGSRSRTHFDPETIDLLRAFCSLVATALARKRAEDHTRRQNAVLAGINHIFQEAMTCRSEDELGRVCLKVLEELTLSRFGFIGELNERTGRMDDLAISNPGWDACRLKISSVDGKKEPGGFEIHGIYGRVLQNGKSLYTNDPASHPDRIGLPPGHAPLTAFLGVPLVQSGKTTGMIGLANREEGYGPQELEVVEALAPAVLQALTSWRAERALRESEERYRSLFNSMTEGFAIHEIITDEAGRPCDYRFLDINPAFERLTGLKRESVVGKTQNEVLPGNNQEWIRKYGETALTGEPIHFEDYSPPLKKHYEVFAYRPAHRQFAVIFMDITERKEAELALAQANISLQAYAEQLQRSNQALEDFAFIASHDLREPLRKVQAFGDLLQSHSSQGLDEHGKHYIERMQAASGRMQSMLDGLLAYSRITTQGQAFKQVDLNQIAADVLLDLEMRLAQTDGRVEIGELPSIEADPVQMLQLFQNLLGNALKFHRPDVPPVVRVWARIPDSDPGSQTADSGQKDTTGGHPTQIEILIEDNGIGFEPSDRKRLFQPFHRLIDRSTYEGTGMGLAICRKIVERHGGSIIATSTPSQGSIFIVLLPCKQRN